MYLSYLQSVDCVRFYAFPLFCYFKKDPFEFCPKKRTFATPINVIILITLKENVCV